MSLFAINSSKTKISAMQSTYKGRLARTFVIFGLALAPIFGATSNINCVRQSAQDLELERKEDEAELLAKLKNLKSMSWRERHRMFEELKKVGGEATVRALIPLLNVPRFRDENVSFVIETLRGIGQPYLQILIDAVKQQEKYDQQKNLIEVIGEMNIPHFEKLKILLNFYTWKDVGIPLFDIENYLKKMFMEKIAQRYMALVHETYNNTSLYGKYSLLNAVGRFGDPGIVKLLLDALNDSNMSIRQRAAQLLKDQTLSKEDINAIWQRVESENDADALEPLLAILHDKGYIRYDACGYQQRKAITRGSRGKLKLERGETLDCYIPIVRSPSEFE